MATMERERISRYKRIRPVEEETHGVPLYAQGRLDPNPHITQLDS